MSQLSDDEKKCAVEKLCDAIDYAGPFQRTRALGITSSDNNQPTQSTMEQQTDFTVDNARALRVANDKAERMHPELKLGCIQAAQKFSNSMDELLQNADRLFHFVAPTPEAFLKYAG